VAVTDDVAARSSSHGKYLEVNMLEIKCLSSINKYLPFMGEQRCGERCGEMQFHVVTCEKY
jgi:hypothetical protein